ncbi:hypothetical protein J7I98_06845 [Streptomyces sp. ISL-98]|uniref:hypothetical protein n=1 Tax=Streptomyces sp. ISL-98 TaxID=2819192 RepID=UPI001BECF116|nr:hypothetical protein [Streptomyces sp. ISL-98]MBT2505624.1 hypothetical protein [Streptomyces sp. ISL-98]
MLDTTPLTAAVDRFADRLRAAPQSRLQRGAAAEGLALARELAVRAQRLEEPESEPRIMPDAGAFAVADQLSVAGHDLAGALQTAPSEQQLDEAVSLVRASAARAQL